MANCTRHTLRDKGIRLLKDSYDISGDGVAHLNVDKALHSDSFQDSVKRLISAKAKITKQH